MADGAHADVPFHGAAGRRQSNATSRLWTKSIIRSSTRKSTTTPRTLKVGAELFTKLQCQSCHPTSNAIPPGKIAGRSGAESAARASAVAAGMGAAVGGGSAKDLPWNRMPAFFPPRRAAVVRSRISWAAMCRSTDPGHAGSPVRHRWWRQGGNATKRQRHEIERSHKKAQEAQRGTSLPLCAFCAFCGQSKFQQAAIYFKVVFLVVHYQP